MGWVGNCPPIFWLNRSRRRAEKARRAATARRITTFPPSIIGSYLRPWGIPWWNQGRIWKYIIYAPYITVTEVCKDCLHFYSNESAFYILEGSFIKICIANSAHRLRFVWRFVDYLFLSFTFSAYSAYRQVLSYRSLKLRAKLYTPSTLNIDLILWHTQLIVCAVKC